MRVPRIAALPVPLALFEARAPFQLLEVTEAFAEGVLGTRSANVGERLDDVVRAPELAIAIRATARDGARRAVTIVDPQTSRRWEIVVALVADGRAATVACVAADVTGALANRRRLTESNARLAALTAFSRSTLTATADELLAAAAAAAAARHASNIGPAAIYFGTARGALECKARAGTREERDHLIPDVIAEERFPILRSVLREGTLRVVASSPALPEDERSLLRNLGMAWLTIVPIGARHAQRGIFLLFSRAATPGVRPEQLQLIEACSGLLALALDRRELYAAVEKERAGLALVLEQIPDAVVIADEYGAAVQANPEARRLFGSSPERGNGANLTFGDLGIPRALAGETVRGALGVVRRDGAEPAWIISSAAPLRTTEGVARGAVAVATDVTAIRRAQDALRVLADASAALAASLDYRGTLPTVARLLVPRVADVCAIDLCEGDRVTRAAFACGDGVPSAIAHGLAERPLAAGGADGALLVEQVSDGDLDTLASDADQLGLLGALGIRSFVRVPIAARDRLYGTLWLAMSASERRYGPDARVLAEDVARRVATAIDNARLYENAQQADRRKDEFLAMLSHELRTPLAPVMAWMQILKRAPDADRVRNAVEVIERNVRLQATLIDDLLDLTAITRGKTTLERAALDLRDVVDAAVDTVRAKVAEKSIVFVRELPEEPVMVEGDANRLQQVVWNLLANAVKFSPDGERVLVSLGCEDDAAVLRVRDRGEGIAPEFLPHVFDMFQQQERGHRRRFGGLGIGLAIARHVTELHRGTISVDSAGAGKGAEFCVRLPLLSGAAVPTARTASTAAFEGRAVLLVEDVPDTREAARLMLESMGVRVVDAAEGQEALAKLEETPIDVVLCDLRMPLMDGFEFIRRVREHPRHRALPVIAVSGYATVDDEARTREAGFDGYVRKPFMEAALAAVVERVLHERNRAAAS